MDSELEILARLLNLDSFLGNKNQNSYDNMVKNRANLNYIDTPAFIKILDQLDMEDKKNVRLVNRQVRSRIEDLEPKLLILTAKSGKSLTDIMSVRNLEGVHLKLDTVKGSELVGMLEKCKSLLLSLKCTPDMIELKTLQCKVHLPKLVRIELNCNYFGRVVVLSSDNCLSFPGPALEFSVPNLKELCLRECEIKTTKRPIVASSKLEKLDIHTCRITDKGFVDLLSCSGQGIKVLNLSRVGVTFENFEGSLLPSLECLQIEFCEGITDLGLYNLLRTVGTDLKELRLINLPVSCGRLQSDLKFPNLETISVMYCQLSKLGLCLLQEMAGDKLVNLEYGS